MLRARFLHLIMTHAWSGNRTRVGGVTGERANHYTTAPLMMFITHYAYKCCSDSLPCVIALVDSLAILLLYIHFYIGHLLRQHRGNTYVPCAWRVSNFTATRVSGKQEIAPRNLVVVQKIGLGTRRPTQHMAHTAHIPFFTSNIHWHRNVSSSTRCVSYGWSSTLWLE